MEILLSKIIGSPVVCESFERPITTVKDLVIEPENGKLIAFLVNINSKKIITPIDVISFNHSLRIHSPDDIIDAADVLRVDTVLKMGLDISQKQVFSQKGEYIGKVLDYSLLAKTLTLQKLYTAKVFWGLVRFDSRIITARDIIEVLPKKIIVRENSAKILEKAIQENLRSQPA